MRISTALISSPLVIFASEKKVPPRHPQSRLRTLTRFTDEWLTKNFEDLLPAEHKGDVNGERLADRFKKRFENWTSRLQALVDDTEKDCFYYDPNAPHGGRSRRDGHEDENENENENEDKTEDESEQYDYSDEADDLVRYDKNNAQRGLRQITTGLRKWALRYISACPGEKNNKAHSMRADRLYRKILNEYNGFFKKFKNV